MPDGAKAVGKAGPAAVIVNLVIVLAGGEPASMVAAIHTTSGRSG